MKIKNKISREICWSSTFSAEKKGKIVVSYEVREPNGCFWSREKLDKPENYDAWLPKLNAWKDLEQSFKDKDLIIDDKFFDDGSDAEIFKRIGKYSNDK